MMNQTRNLRVLLLCLIFSLTAACSLQAAVIYVDLNATGLNDGSSWANAYTDLAPALSASTSGDEIWVADGTYYPGVSGDNAATYPLKKGVVVYGGFTGVGGLEETTLSQRDFRNNLSILSGDLDQSGTPTANDAYHVVDAIGEDTTAIVDGCIISGGNAVGAGIDNRGGGAQLISGGASFINCIFEDNNTSNFGGAIYGNSQMTLINCLFRRNTSSQRGGALYQAGGPVKVYNCVFVENTAVIEGGAMFMFPSGANTAQCSFFNNTAPNGAAIRSFNSGHSVQNCILWGNTGSEFSGTATVDHCLIEGGLASGTNIIDADPLFLDGLLRIGACSPAAEAGDSLTFITDDYDGNPRPFDADNDATAKWDLGAFEAQQFAVDPLPNAITGPNPACASGQDDVYTVTNNNSPTNIYSWNLIGGGSIDGPSDSSSVLVDWGSNVGTYLLIVTESVAATACSINETLTVSLDTVPIVNINPTGTGTICDEDSLQLNAVGNGIAFQWTLNGNPVLGATGSSFFAKDSGFVNVVITDGRGCTDSASSNFELVVNPLPDITFSTSVPLPICQGDSVTLSVAAGVSQQWYESGNPIAGQTGTSLTVSSPGFYNLFQTDANTCSDSAEMALEVIVNPLPVVNLNPTGTDTICPGDSLSITGLSGGSQSFQWTRDGNPVAGGTNNPFFASVTGLYNVLLTDTNNCTDSAGVGHRVQVGDFELPNPVCRDDTFYLDFFGNVTIAPSILDGGSTDNCEVDSLAASQTSFSCLDSGLNVVTLTVFDGVGNSNSCTSNIRIEDTISPVAVCLNPTLYLDAGGNLVVVPADLDGGSVDNCGVVNGSVSQSNFSCSDTGSVSLTLTVFDAAGNSSQCSANVTIADSTAPLALCQDTVVTLDAFGVASINTGAVNANSSDNCGIASIALDQTSFACSDVPSVTVTLTLTDVSGNVGTCQALVRVRDTVAPVAVCQDTIIFIDPSGQALLTTNELDGGSSDNCGIVSGFLSQSNFSCLDTGLTVVTVSFVDADTNISSCLSNVTVRDTVPPTAVCSDTTFYLDSFGVAIVEPLVFGANSVDNCTFFDTAYVDIGPFGCLDTGQYTAMLVVVDVAGQRDSCSGTVSIADSTGPFVLCRDTSLVLDGAGNAAITAADLDLGTTDNCTLDSIYISQSSFSCADAGFNSVVFTAVDNFGNTSNCISTVEIIDSVPPVAQCQNLTLYLDAFGSASLSTMQVDNGSSDNCGVDSLALSQSNFSCLDTGLNVVTLEVFDQYGNAVNCQANITVLDTTPPAAICNDSTVYLDASGNFPLSFGLIGSASFDNCLVNNIVFNGNSFTCLDTGINVIQMTLDDPSGNMDSCTATVTVIDSTAPTAACADTTLYLDSLGNLSITALTVAPQSFDNCQIVSSNVSTSNFGCGDIGVNALTASFTDPSGNTSTCNFNLTVLDSLAPTPICQSNTLIINGLGFASLNTAMADGGSFDGCGIDSIYLSQTLFSCIDVGNPPVTLFVRDFSGNLDSCQVPVSVQDTVLPTAVCNSVVVYVDSMGNVNLSPSDLDGGSDDNCFIDTLMLNPPTFDCNNFGTNFTQLIVQDNGGNLDSCSATVTVLDSIAPVAICDSIVVQLNSNGGALFTPTDLGGSSFDNCAISNMTLSTDSLNCSDLGSNVVTLTLTDSSGNQNSCAGIVNVVDTNGTSIVPVNLGPDTIVCNQDSILLAPDASYASYAWSTGAMTMSILINQPGDYALEVLSAEGCFGRDSITVSSANVADPNLRTESGETVICQNDSLELIADPGFSTFLWSNGDTNSSTVVYTAGTYTLVVSDPSGCTLASSVQVAAVNAPAPDPIISPPGPSLTLCEGDVLTLDAGGGYFQYQWNNGATTQMISVGDPGTYSVEVWNGFGCHTVADPVTLVPAAAPIPAVAQNGDTLSTSSPGAIAWQWNLEGSPIFNANDSTYVATVSGNYTVTATYANGCTRTSLPLPLLVALGEAQSELRGISAYPNPSDGVLFVRSVQPLHGSTQIRLFDHFGREVFGRSLPGIFGETELDLSGLAQGLYQLEVSHAKGRAQFQIVIY